MNLIHSTRTAASGDIAEVMVCMFGPTSDQYGLLHRGTRVRKMHSSYRSTFRTISDIPLAMVDRNGVTPLRADYKRRRSDKNVKLDTAFDEKVSIVYYYPNMAPDIIDSLVDNGYHGIVIAGTGLGHVNRPLYPALKRAHDKGVAICMAVQTIWGFAQMYVYETGREIMELGVFPAANMLPEVAYMKLCWALGHTRDLQEVERMMVTPINGEITEREPHNGYLVFQGGVPEVEEFIRSYRK
jgi:glutamyl-tRNA(Gln) amidotransferase subunit D